MLPRCQWTMVAWWDLAKAVWQHRLRTAYYRRFAPGICIAFRSTGSRQNLYRPGAQFFGGELPSPGDRPQKPSCFLRFC